MKDRVLSLEYDISTNSDPDWRPLTSELVQTLRTMLPTPAEYGAALRVDLDKSTDKLLQTVSKIFRALGSVKLCKERLDFLDFFHAWHNDLANVTRCLDSLRSGADQIHAMLPVLRAFCATALDVTNFLNAGKYNQHARALSFDALKNLSTKKKSIGGVDITAFQLIDEILEAEGHRPFYDVPFEMAPINEAAIDYHSKVEVVLLDLQANNSKVSSLIDCLSSDPELDSDARNAYLRTLNELSQRMRDRFTPSLERALAYNQEVREKLNGLYLLFCEEVPNPAAEFKPQDLFMNFRDIVTPYKAAHQQRQAAKKAAITPVKAQPAGSAAAKAGAGVGPAGMPGLVVPTSGTPLKSVKDRFPIPNAGAGAGAGATPSKQVPSWVKASGAVPMPNMGTSAAAALALRNGRKSPMVRLDSAKRSNSDANSAPANNFSLVADEQAKPAEVLIQEFQDNAERLNQEESDDDDDYGELIS